MARHWLPDRTFTVLFVCTGNICRSAMAEGLSRAYLDDALGSESGLVRVHSAGVQAVAGSGVHPDSAVVLAGLGGGPAAFTARQLVDDMAIDADLTLTATRSHRRQVLRMAPRALNRTFTLREAADLLTFVDPTVELAGRSFADRCRSLVQAMADARARRSSTDADDIADPIGRPLEVHQAVGDEVAEALVPLLSRFVALRGKGDEGSGAATGTSPPLPLVS